MPSAFTEFSKIYLTAKVVDALDKDFTAQTSI